MIQFRRTVVCLGAAIIVTGCSADPAAVMLVGDGGEQFVSAGEPVPLTPLVQLDLPTYEHSGQAVHPDVVRFPSAWNGWEYWMAMTPYPGAKAVFENPSILVSHDGLKWIVPAGVTNPLAHTPTKSGYNSDPDLSFDVTGNRLVMVYREVTATDNIVHTVTSTDGVHWSRPVELFKRPNHGMVSPTVSAGPDGVHLWYVNAGPKSCLDRVTRVEMQSATLAAALAPATSGKGWTEHSHVTLVQAGASIWHIDVTWIDARQEYWAVYSAYPGHACSQQDLYFARSSDGVKWTTYRAPFLSHADAPWLTTTLYRASVMYDESRGVIQFFVSGAAGTKWQVGYVDYQLQTFLTALGRADGVQAQRAPLPTTAADTSFIAP